MIKFFRLIRQNLLSEGKTGKYFKYALGEIILVVIGILIALQINNWNQERIQNIELNSLLDRIGSSVQSDIRDLNLLTTARRNMGEKSTSIFEDFITSEVNTISMEDVTFIGLAFQEINNLIYFRSNLSAFESLNNSTYNRKIQNTDLASLLNAYYTNAEKIKEAEARYNEQLEFRNQAWFSKFRDNSTDQQLFLNPWSFADDFSSVEGRYLEILRDASSRSVIGSGFFEPYLINQYEEQILMGSTIVDMIQNSETAFDTQTKLDFSGILYSFSDADILGILINGKVPTGFTLRNAASGLLEDYFTNEEDCLGIEYPEKTYDWASPYFEVGALGGRVNEMDFSGYTKLVLEMKGAVGGESFEIAMKDKNDPSDGSESRVKIELTDDWKTFEIETSQFKTADMKNIMVPFAIIFQGPVGRKIQIRSIQFKKD
ncbi:MAG: hypothetical protein KJN68_12825 [Bacteroidia bacterium]|nr:hypothetical protein [Bacteroidia bacterium]